MSNIWSKVGGVWIVNKRYKSVDWSEVDWTLEGHIGCPYCMQELGCDTSQNNFMVYGLDDNGLPRGGHCHGVCNTTIVSVEKAIEDEQNKSSTDGKISALSKKSNINSIKEEIKVSFASNKGNRDEQKLKEVRLSSEQLENIYSETSEDLKCSYRGLDKSICKELSIRWKYDEKTGKVSEMWCPYHIKENGEIVITGYKVRKAKPTEKQQKFYSVGYVGKLNCMFGETFEVNESIVYVGGEIDVVSATQMIRQGLSKYPSRKVTVVSSPLGEPMTAELIKTNWDFISKHTKHVLALDNDDAGKKSQEDCKEILPLECTLEAHLALKDANEYLNPRNGKTAEDYTRAVYWNPTPCKSFGIVDSANLLQSAIEAVSKERIKLPPYLNELNDVFKGGIGLQEIVNLISAPSLGKSVFVNEIVLHWLIHSPYKNFIISTEDGAGSYTAKIASRIIGNKILAAETIPERVKLLEDNAELINSYLRDEDGVGRFSILDEIPQSLEDMQQVILQAIKIHGCQVIITDTLSSVIGSRSNQEQEDWMNFLEHTRRNYDVTFINVTHTKKTQDGKALSEGGEATEEMIKGSGAIAQTATVNIILRRNKMAEDEIDKNTTYVDVVKNRTIGTTGRGLAKVYYSNVLHTLFDFTYAESNNFFEGVTPEQFKGLQDNNKSVAVSAPKDEYIQGMEDEEEIEIPF